jgi:hypothetical protein
MFMYRYQNARENCNIKTANKYFENIANLKCFGTIVTNRNNISEEIKNRWNSGNAPYIHLKNSLSCLLLSKNVKIKIY